MLGPLTAQDIIEWLHLEPLPVEGGWFRQSYASHDEITQGLPARYTGKRVFGSAIYYLLSDHDGSFSALHRLLTDELYHFYLGDPVEMLLLETGGASRRVILGPDLLHRQHVQFVVPAGVWQGSLLVPGGRFALLGTTLAPGFDRADFTLGERADLQSGWPAEAALIASLTRNKV